MKARRLVLFIFIFSNLVVFNKLTAQFRSEIEIVKSITSAKNANEKFQFQIELVQCYLNSNLEKAQAKLNELKKNTGRKTGHEANLLKLAEMRYYLQIKDFLSFQNCQNGLQLSNFKNSLSKIEYLSLVGSYKREKQDFDQALLIHKQALTIAKKVRNNYVSAEILRNMSLDFAYLDKKDSALFYSNRSITIARKTNILSGILSECFNSQALIYRHFNQIDIGIAKNILALEISETTSNNEKLSRFNREIGISQLDIQNWGDAEKYFQKSLSFAKSFKDNAQIALALINLAAVQHGKKITLNQKN